MSRFFALTAHLLLATLSFAQVKTEDVTYKQDTTPLKGLLAYEKSATPRPAILIVHEWWGHNEHARTQAKKFAAGGFVTFAVDMYGEGKVASHPKDAGTFMNEVMKSPDLLKARFNAAVDFLKSRKEVDPSRIGAAGYCFGGTVSLTMAREGVDLKAVATFHAGLKPVAGEAQKATFKPAVLVQTGGADPMIPADQVAAFEKEMKSAGAKFEVKVFPSAKHAFTNPDAGKAGLEALKYDAEADKDSFERAMGFFKNALK